VLFLYAKGGRQRALDWNIPPRPPPRHRPVPPRYRAHQTIVSIRTKKYVRNLIKLGRISEDLIAIISYAHFGS
jgi:hypothetical protein